MLEYNVSPGAHAEDIDVRRLLKLTGFTIALFAIGLAILYIQNPVLLFIYYGCITGAESPIDCVTGKPTRFRSSLFGMRYEGETEDLIDWHVLVLGAYEKPELFSCAMSPGVGSSWILVQTKAFIRSLCPNMQKKFTLLSPMSRCSNGSDI